MNYFDFLKSIRLKIDDEKKSRFPTDEPLRLAINESYRHIYNVLISNNIMLNTVATTISFVANVQETALPTDVRRIIHVQDSNQLPIPIYDEAISKRSGDRSVYISRQQAVNITRTARSTRRADALGWYVNPSSAFDLTVVYLKTLIVFSDRPNDADTIEDIPSEYHDIIVLYSVVLLLGVDEDNSNFWFNMYGRAQENMLQSIRQENFDTDSVVDVRGEF